MTTMRLTVIGCSGSVPGPDSAASCYLLEVDQPTSGGRPRTWRFLLDLGSGALGPLQRFLDPRDVDAVLITHLHADHFLDLSGLYVMQRFAPPIRESRPPIAVWGPAGLATRMAVAYGLDEDPGMSAEFQFGQWSDREPQQIGPVTVTPMVVRHPVLAFGLRIECGGKVLAYTGDTDSCPALRDLCREATLMLADAAYVDGGDDVPGVHLTAARAAKAAAEAGGVHRLILTHLPPWIDPQVSLSQARAVWPGVIDVAYPRASYTL